MVYLARMPGKRKFKAVTSGSLGFYRTNASELYFYQGSAEDGRTAIKLGKATKMTDNTTHEKEEVAYLRGRGY